MSQLVASGGQSIGVLASTSVIVNINDILDIWKKEFIIDNIKFY